MASEKNLYYRVSWNDFEKATKILAQKLKTKRWEGIVAITRGGLVPANNLAYALGIKNIETIGIESYQAIADQRDIKLLKSPSEKVGNGKNWLFVDDLADNGTTADFVRKLYPGATLTATYAKTHGKSHVDLYAVETPKESWIILPWDEDPDENCNDNA